jgi:hypothetical protein
MVLFPIIILKIVKIKTEKIVLLNQYKIKKYFLLLKE